MASRDTAAIGFIGHIKHCKTESNLSSVYQTKHVSIRVPWHDSKWNGSICANPAINSHCVVLKNIGLNKDDALESSLAGSCCESLNESQRPACMAERGMFMAPYPIIERKSHPYAISSPKTHGHLKQTSIVHPPYSAALIPYYWMLRENANSICADLGLPFEDRLEPEIGDWAKNWVQHGRNQEALLDGFLRHVQPQESLCFFYAKQTPMTDDPRRVIVGIGRIRSVAPARSYDMDEGGPFHSLIWDRPVEHSIRPENLDGFLLPYHDGLAFASKNPDYDISRLALLAPEGKQREFSFVSELVSDDSAIAVLEDALRVIRIAREDLAGPWAAMESWIADSLARLWIARGEYPGLGSVLSGFGVRLGSLVGWELQRLFDSDSSFAAVMNRVWERPADYLPAALAVCLEPTLARTWNSLSQDSRQSMEFFSRLSISAEQAKFCIHEKIAPLSDPYLLARASGEWEEPITCASIDRALFPAGSISSSTNVLIDPPVTGPLDERRLLAYSYFALERAANEGHSLLPQSELIDRLENEKANPEIGVSADILSAIHKDWLGQIDTVSISPDQCGYQLTRLCSVRELIVQVVTARTSATSRRHALPGGWPPDKSIFGDTTSDEQQAALRELFQSRFSVLLGPAGSGKTTILATLCTESSIKSGGFEAIAPTGKARVRLQGILGGQNALTLAQFLLKYDRYDVDTGRYHLSEKPGHRGAETLIVDEASMLTEEMLAAFLQATQAAKRIILVGDPNQLPPIGTGRPFFDIATHLRPRESLIGIATGYAVLSTRHRQVGENRLDLDLADSFIGGSEDHGEGLSFILCGGESERLRYEQWLTDAELEPLIQRVLVEELALAGSDDQRGFDKSLGSNVGGFFDRFAANVDGWQLLTPYRSGAFGSITINRHIHDRFRKEKLAFAQLPYYMRRTLRPTGPERIVYGDKVIVNKNGPRKAYGNGLGYVANGETGTISGPFARSGGGKLYPALNVTLGSQPGCNYPFWVSEFTDNSAELPPLELAYSLTIHKAQGSEYDIVIVILPEPCRLLSRELLYTAFTRQTRRLILLHQGTPAGLRKYQSDRHSELARRLTNLFEPPSVRILDGVPFEERLIHVSRRGEPMRSKSEVIVADNLTANDIDYAYEKPLQLDGKTRWPDFTIEKADTGQTFYWEHCGMLSNPAYASRWAEKLESYRRNGILPVDEGDGANGSLLVTRDDEVGGISSRDINNIIRKCFGRSP